MKFRTKIQLTLLAGALATACPIVGQAAATEYAKTDVVLRSGPSALFPAVGTVLAGSRVHMYGCTKQIRWCDVRVCGRRGWIPSGDVDIEYHRQRMPISTYVHVAEKPAIAVVSFDIDTYWSQNYSQLYFYDEIGNWRTIN